MADEEDWAISHKTPEHIMSAFKILASLGHQNAFALAVKYNGDVVAAIESVFEKPETAGDKYIPSKPKVDSGLTPEQEEMCKRGRWLQDQVNAVFSVAHSKIRTQPESVPETSQLENQPEVSHPVAEVSIPTQQPELQLDSPEKIAQPDQQYGMPQ